MRPSRRSGNKVKNRVKGEKRARLRLVGPQSSATVLRASWKAAGLGNRSGHGRKKENIREACRLAARSLIKKRPDSRLASNFERGKEVGWIFRGKNSVLGGTPNKEGARPGDPSQRTEETSPRGLRKSRARMLLGKNSGTKRKDAEKAREIEG